MKSGISGAGSSNMGFKSQKSIINADGDLDADFLKRLQAEGHFEDIQRYLPEEGHKDRRASSGSMDNDFYHIQNKANGGNVALVREYQMQHENEEQIIQKDVVTVLIIATGGTIMMENSEHGYIPAENFIERMKMYRNFHDQAFAKEEEYPDDVCITPVTPLKKRIRIHMLEYKELIDSSNAKPKDWVTIAKSIEENYRFYDGFVILHGTDTMSYTASALSFMLENLNKTVIITGSQIPMSELRNDAEENLLAAILIAG